MSTAASAVTTVDSATTEEQQSTPAAPVFDAGDQHTWSPAQRENWNRTGDQPTKADSAPANKDSKDTAAPDSAPDTKNDKKNAADSASDSATDNIQKPHRKDKEDTERRFKELLDRVKKAEERAEAAERAKSSDTRDSKQVSQPAKEEYQPLDEKKYFAENPKATYEDFVRAAIEHGVAHGSKKVVQEALAAERQRIAQESAQKDLQSKVEEGRKRYEDFDTKVFPALEELYQDKQVPLAIKAMLDESPVLVDLLYVLRSDDKTWTEFRALSKSNPAAAIRKLVLTEQLVHSELAKAKTSGKDKGDDETDAGKTDAGKTDAGKTDAAKTRDASGKFVSSSEKDKSSDAASEPKPRAPKPPSEVGGRGTAADDALRTAAEKNDFRSFEAEQNRRMKARHA